jgi:CBS domain-containing protein
MASPKRNNKGNSTDPKPTEPKSAKSPATPPNSGSNSPPTKPPEPKDTLKTQTKEKSRRKWTFPIWSDLSDKTKQSIVIFSLLTIAYFIIFLLIKWKSGITFTTNLEDNIMNLVTTLPLIALYILVFIGATAGVANSAKMLKSLPINTMINKELDKRYMSDKCIKGRVRYVTKLKEDSKFEEVLASFVYAKIPIIPIVKDKEATGVITYRDILNTVYKSEKDNKLADLSKKTAKELYEGESGQLITVKDTDTLKTVLGKMLENRYHKLIVIDENKNFRGMVDIMDILGELFSNVEEDDSE